ncbi:MAG: thiosulfate oxidation carrier protein SoxY [Gammaproteobacteria bacterium]|nr:thiosulfate oxidation carrier protein SoxY [Gammaproteobacteria bacterium]
MKRRSFLQQTLAVAASLIAGGSGLLYLPRAHAARPDAAFLAKDLDTVLKEVLGGSEATVSDQIKLDAPLQAENGAVVPVVVSTTLPAPESIAIIVPKNPTPLLTMLDTTPRTGSFVRMRIKMAGTDEVQVYVKSGGQWYMASQEVRVAVGGCGG